MKVVAYLRVSTDRQAEEGVGLDVQTRAIKDWAKANGHQVVHWTRDEGVSGSNGLDTRQGLADAIGYIEDQALRPGLVVYRLDRLARDLLVQETVLAELRKLGAAVFSTQGGESENLNDDPKDPSRKLIRQVLGGIAEYERALIKLRTHSGRARVREQGYYAGDGQPPWGTVVAPAADDPARKVLAPDPTTADAQALIARMHGQGASTRQIAAALNEAGHTPKQGGQWHPTQVWRAIRRAEGHPNPSGKPKRKAAR